MTIDNPINLDELLRDIKTTDYEQIKSKYHLTYPEYVYYKDFYPIWKLYEIKINGAKE